MNDLLKKLKNKFYGAYDFVQTSPCGRGQHHPHGLVGNLWRIKDPGTIRIGDCFLRGRLRANDLFLCTKHSGDYFQDYMYVHEYTNGLQGVKEWSFGSYGIGDSVLVELNPGEFELLLQGTFVKRTNPWI